MANELIVGVSDVARSPEDGFISQVLSMPDGERKVELLDKLLTMREAERARAAKLDFDTHFAELRAELEPIQRTKKNEFLKSKYAPLEAMQELCDPIIAKHGFAYSWREEDLTDGRKKILMDITGWGHSRTNSWVAPAYEGVKNRDGGAVTNSLQSAGIQSSYGERRTFKQGFGIVTVDEDTDGDFRSVKIDADLQEAINRLIEAETTEKLMDIYKIAFERYKSDPDKKRMIIGAYNEAKQKIIGGK